MRSPHLSVAGRASLAVLTVSLAAVVGTLGIGAGSAHATSCARPGPEQLTELAAVVTGTVTAKVSTGVVQDSFGEPAEIFDYPLADVEVLYGEIVADEVTVVLAEQNGINLGGDLIVGTRYGFTLYEASGSELPIDICSFDTADAIRELTGVEPGEGSELSPSPTTTPSTTTTSTPGLDPPASDERPGWVGPAIGIAGLTLIAAVGVTIARRRNG